MNIGIIGVGFVGTAIASAHCTDNVTLVDPKIQNSATIKDLTHCDAVYVCVPSPSTPTGDCDTSILENALHDLSKLPDFNNLVVISKVTAPPGIYQELLEGYPNLVHAPEFLTANNATEDYINGTLVVVGGNDYWVNRAASVIAHGKNMSADNVIKTDIATASLYKYLANSYLATKVTFMNEFYKLAEHYSIEWTRVTDIIKQDSRIGGSHTSVPGPDGQFGWGGYCFPKDVAAICKDAAESGISFELLSHVKNINDQHRERK